MRKKAERGRRKAAHEILDLVLDMNGLQASRQEVTGNHPTAFYKFSGHVGMLRVAVYAEGYGDGAESREFEATVCGRKPYYGERTLEETIRELRQLKKEIANKRRGDIAMGMVTCRSCRRRNKCMEYSRMYVCRSYKKRTPGGWSRPEFR